MHVLDNQNLKRLIAMDGAYPVEAVYHTNHVDLNVEAHCLLKTYGPPAPILAESIQDHTKMTLISGISRIIKVEDHPGEHHRAREVQST